MRRHLRLSAQEVRALPRWEYLLLVRGLEEEFVSEEGRSGHELPGDADTLRGLGFSVEG